MRTSDQLIISFLRQDSRVQLTKMSKKTNIPVSTLFERMKHYKNGLIKKNTTLVDFSKLGYEARAKVLLKVKQHKIQACKEHLENCHLTNELFRINNGYDFLVEFIAKNMKELQEYLDKLCDQFEIEEQQVCYVVEELKREDFLAKPNLLLLGHTVNNK